MNAQELQNLHETYLKIYESNGILSSLDKVARDTVSRVGGEIGARQGREKFGNVLGIPERIGRSKGSQQAQQTYDKITSPVRKVLSQSYDPYFEEEEEDIDEALKPSVVRAAARQQYTSQAVKQKVASGSGGSRGSGSSPGSVKPQPQDTKKLSMTRLYHGTTKPASQQISKSGWRTDKNVTRQMTGSSVYTTPQKSAAQMYANQRANQRGESPAVRTFRVPTKTVDKVKSNREKQGTWSANKGDQKFNVVQMSPRGANRYDVTDKPQSAGAIKFKGPQKQELNQRTSTALSKPRNVSALKRDINKAKVSRMGGSSSLSGVGPSGSTGRYQVGASRGYGISGIRLADHYDVYDIILTYLIDEGYAETPKAAEIIMVNMSEEWREDIIESRKKVKIHTDKPIQYKIADIGPGGKEYNVKTGTSK